MTYEDQVTKVSGHVRAISRLLLGSRRLNPSASIVAGPAQEGEGRLYLAQLASQTATDIVHVGLDAVEDRLVVTDISLFIPRDGICWIKTGCRLYLPRSGSRAIIVPSAQDRGSFRLAPSEIIHVDKRPADVEEGVARAMARLTRLVENGVDVTGQVDINVYSLAA